MMVRMYRKMYTTLFNAVTEALDLIARAQYIDAEAVLKKAQLETEQTFIFWEEQDVSPLPAQQELPAQGPDGELGKVLLEVLGKEMEEPGTLLKVLGLIGKWAGAGGEEDHTAGTGGKGGLVFKEDLGDACGGECGGVQVILGGAPVEGLPDVGELCGDCEAWAPPAIAGELDGEESGPA